MKLYIALYSCFGPPGAHPTVQAPWFAILASVMHKLGNCVSMFLADFANPSWSCIALPLKAQWSEAVRCRAAEALPLCSVTWINPGGLLGWFCFIYRPLVWRLCMNTCELRKFVLPKYGFEGGPKALLEAGFVVARCVPHDFGTFSWPIWDSCRGSLKWCSSSIDQSLRLTSRSCNRSGALFCMVLHGFAWFCTCADTLWYYEGNSLIC